MSWFSRLFGTSQEEETTPIETPESAVPLTTYRNSQAGFSISTPEGWAQEFEGGGLIIHPKDAKTLSDGGMVVFTPALTILIGGGAQTDDPLQTARKIVSGFKDNFMAFRLLWQKEITIASGEKGIRYSFTFRKAGAPFRTVGIAVCKDNRMYLCDLSATEEQSSRYAALANRILPSLVI